MNLAPTYIGSIATDIEKYIFISMYKVLPQKSRASMVKPKYTSLSE